MAANASIAFFDGTLIPPVRGFVHPPDKANGNGLVLTHGAGSNCHAPLLRSLAETFAAAGYVVLRCDLPFRQDRPTGPPFPGNAERDRAGLRNAVAALRKSVVGKLFLAGHSYGGRQATMLCAEEPELVSGLLLLSYPLHPPRKPEQLRVQHLPSLRTPSLFVHGSRDPFASVEELQKAMHLIAAKHELLEVDGAGHDLKAGKKAIQELPGKIVAAFESLMR